MHAALAQLLLSERYSDGVLCLSVYKNWDSRNDAAGQVTFTRLGWNYDKLC